MKWKFAILFILILGLIAGSGAYFYISKKNSSQALKEPTATSTSSPTPTSYAYTQTNFFAVVTGFKNKLIKITSQQLSQKQIFVTSKDLEEIKKIDFLKSANFSTVDSTEDLVKKLNTEETSIGIQSIDDLSFKLKTLEIDNQFLFDKRVDLAKYPLKTTTTLSSTTNQTNTSNYEVKQLTKFGHTGAVIPARGVQYWIERKFNNDYTTLFKSTKPLFDTFDYLSATFEAPVLNKGKLCDSCMTLVGPDKFMEGVKYSGIDLFSTAANHMLDGGTAALANTQQKLDELGIKRTGSSTLSNDDAGKPVLVEVNGLKIAYLGFNDTPGRGTWAGENKPGAASISDWEVDANGRTTKYQPNEERIKYFLQRAKDLKPDLIFVIMHWGGKEYEAAPLPYTKNLAKLLTENGADVILGDHPHWVQEIEFRGDKPVFYCVGNFVFDQMWSVETQQGMTLELNYVGKKLVNIRLHPHQLDLYEKGMPVLLKPEDPGYQQTLNRVFEVSRFE